MKPTVALGKFYEKSEPFSNSAPKVRCRAVLRVHSWVRRSAWWHVLRPYNINEPFLLLTRALLHDEEL